MSDKFCIKCSLESVITKKICTDEGIQVIKNDSKDTIPIEYMKRCKQMIVGYIFDKSVFEVPYDELTCKYKEGAIQCKFIFNEKPSRKQIKKYKEEIEDMVEGGADSWGGSDITDVTQEVCEEYDLGNIENENVYYDVFYHFGGFGGFGA
jgi:hypothetical protein